jgi:hypothetical protein
MTNQLQNNGETFTMQNDLGAVTYNVGLYDDSVDGLIDSDGYAQITTEPTGSAYAVQSQGTVTIQLDGSDNGQIVLDPVTFDVSDSSASVDSVYIRDSTSGDLLFTNNIGSQDLSTKDGSLEISNIGFSLD